MIKIVDNFFDDPDSVVSLSEAMDFSLANPQWPGVRTQDLKEHSPEVKDMFIEHICGHYPKLNPFELNNDFRCGFQKVNSFSKDQYDLKNKGWAHRDTNCIWAGIMYLNKNPEPDTGTVFYKGTQDKSLYKECLKQKMDLYVGASIDEEKYKNAYEKMHSELEVDFIVEPVYNRMIIFKGSEEYHAGHTYGLNQTRLTFVWFALDNPNSPFRRYAQYQQQNVPIFK